MYKYNLIMFGEVDTDKLYDMYEQDVLDAIIVILELFLEKYTQGKGVNIAGGMSFLKLMTPLLPKEEKTIKSFKYDMYNGLEIEDKEKRNHISNMISIGLKSGSKIKDGYTREVITGIYETEAVDIKNNKHYSLMINIDETKAEEVIFLARDIKRGENR